MSLDCFAPPFKAVADAPMRYAHCFRGFSNGLKYNSVIANHWLFSCDIGFFDKIWV